MSNKNLQKSAMNSGSLIKFYWRHFIAITYVFKIGGIYMSISCRMKWNATTSILNIMTSNYLSEFHFCLRDQSETHFCLKDQRETRFCLRDRSKDFFKFFFTPPPPPLPTPLPIIPNFPLVLIFGKVSNPPIIPNPPIIRYSRVCTITRAVLASYEKNCFFWKKLVCFSFCFNYNFCFRFC